MTLIDRYGPRLQSTCRIWCCKCSCYCPLPTPTPQHKTTLYTQMRHKEQRQGDVINRCFVTRWHSRTGQLSSLSSGHSRYKEHVQDCEMEVSLPHSLNLNRPGSPLARRQSWGDAGDSASVCANVILTHWNLMRHPKFYCLTVGEISSAEE